MSKISIILCGLLCIIAVQSTEPPRGLQSVDDSIEPTNESQSANQSPQLTPNLSRKQTFTNNSRGQAPKKPTRKQPRKPRGKKQPSHPIAKTPENYESPPIPDFNSFDDYTGPFKRTYEEKDFKVDMERELYGTMKIHWTKGNVEVNMTTYRDNTNKQEWKFGKDATIKIDNNANSSTNQLWKIGDKQYKLTITTVGDFIPSGDASLDDVEKYRKEIDSWCNVNRKLYPIQHCVIYDTVAAYIVPPQTNTNGGKLLKKYQTPTIQNFKNLDFIDGAFRRNYVGDFGTVDLERERNGALKLDWKIGTLKVLLSQNENNDISQQWTFPDATITVNTDAANGTKDIFWKLGNKTYKYHEDSTGKVTASGNATQQDLAKYEKEMTEWCRVNGKIFPIKSCSVFRRSTKTE